MSQIDTFHSNINSHSIRESGLINNAINDLDNAIIERQLCV